MHQSYLQTIADMIIEDEEMSTNPGKKPNYEPEHLIKINQLLN